MCEINRKPVWKRKRWIAAAATLWLVMMYPLSAGPVSYTILKGWLPFGVYNVYVLPACRLGYALGGSYFGEYLAWWIDLSGFQLTR